jgi:lysophospholipase L1-like esterase
MAALGVPYYDTFPLSIDAGGGYEPYLPADPNTGERKMARTNDGIHMTIPGYIHAIRGLSDRIRGSVAEARAQNAHAAPSVSQAANEHRRQEARPS